ncbi:MAG: hypothetical protein M9882_07470 [Homoserinimonas sp.]|nr:hypothetical protein [Homoserinimonas sp.]
MNERLIVYVDGFNLYHGMHQRFQRRYLWLDVPFKKSIFGSRIGMPILWGVMEALRVHKSFS